MSELPEKTVSQSHLPWLDGLRGLAAMWVVVHHCFILVGGREFPILSWGQLAVDLFMMLSGFLMAHHYLLRRNSHDWKSPRTWREFWLKRYFRIAPLYYVLLALALALGPVIGQYRDLIAVTWPATATNSARYLDSSLQNILIHISFVFGVFPDYAFRTVLPDWSIGLEMQFYLAFPFLMIIFSRLGFIRGGFLVFLVCVLGGLLFRNYYRSFPMPAFLPLKLHIFLIGIWLAVGRSTGNSQKYFLPALLICLLLVVKDRSLESAGRVAIVLGLTLLISPSEFLKRPRAFAIVEQIQRVMSNRLSRFLGDTSYGVYLLHLLLLIPIAGYLSTMPAFNALPVAARLIGCILCLAPPAYLGAWLLHLAIERPGIAMGKKATRVHMVSTVATTSQ